MKTRTDEHRLSQFKPESYDYLFSYSGRTSDGFPGYNLELRAATRTGRPQHRVIVDANFKRIGSEEITSPWGKLSYFTGGNGACACCGASFIHGSVYRHRETGEAIDLGHICCEKSGLYTDDEYQAAYKARVAQARESRRALNAQRAGLRRWVVANRETAKLLHVDHKIARSMREKLIDTGAKWGLSDAQVALLKKLKHDLANRVEEVKASIPVTGDERVEITGEIVSTKFQDNDFGGRYVMTVKVTTDAGIYLLWGTVPSKLGDDARRGLKVSFFARVEVSDRDASFGFIKRPTKIKILNPELLEENAA